MYAEALGADRLAIRDDHGARLWDCIIIDGVIYVEIKNGRHITRVRLDDIVKTLRSNYSCSQLNRIN